MRSNYGPRNEVALPAAGTPLIAGIILRQRKCGMGWAKRGLLCVLTALPCTPDPGQGQSVRGIVRDELSEAGVSAAEIGLVDSTGVVTARAISDSNGLFMLTVPAPGTYRLRAERFGYASFITRPMRVDQDFRLFAELRLEPSPIAVGSVETSVEARHPRLHRLGFYDRRQRAMGGYFVTSEQIRQRSAVQITDLLRGFPGVEVLYAGEAGREDVVMRAGRTSFSGTCFPTVAIDGVIVRRGGTVLKRPGGIAEVGEWSHLVHPNSILAIEIYPSSAGLPVQFAGSVSPCGAILIWTL